MPNQGSTQAERAAYDAMNQLFDGVYFVNTERQIQFWNGGAERLTGYKSCEAVGSYCWNNMLAHVDEDGRALCHDGCPLQASIEDGAPREADIFLRHKDGHRVSVHVRVAPMLDVNGDIVGGIEVFTDNTIRETILRRVAEMERMAQLDGLTNLANRRYMEDTLDVACSGQDRRAGQGGVLFMDVDHFKRINDTFGHDAGDMVLKMVAGSLANALRANDTAARWGGEEFVAHLSDVSAESLFGVARRVQRLIAESSLVYNGERLATTVSIGATLIETGDTRQTVFKRADALMYRSKEAGRNCVTVG